MCKLFVLLVTHLLRFDATVLMQVLTEAREAVGVEYEMDDATHEVRARKEVILSAGTFGSPQILMLSGIGPKDDLKKLKVCHHTSRGLVSTVSAVAIKTNILLEIYCVFMNVNLKINTVHACSKPVSPVTLKGQTS